MISAKNSRMDDVKGLRRAVRRCSRTSKLSLAWVGVLLGLASTGFAETTAPAPKYGPSATRLQDAPEYLRKADAPDFWSLISYYVPQRNGSSCSLASTAMVVNAARGQGALSAADGLVTQDGLLEKTKDRAWSRAVGKGGGGVTLDELGPIVERSLKAYGLPVIEARVVHWDAAAPEAAMKQLRATLEANEKSKRDFVIVNFLQSVYTGDPEGKVGHIAPLAAFDARRERALILDPDREYYEPYWVSLKTLADGMATQDSGAKKTRGYVYVRLAP